MPLSSRATAQARIPFTAPEPIRRALNALGRTEDVKFSPSDRRIALAGFAASRILVLDLVVDASSGAKRIALTDGLELASPALRSPHGVCFLDDDTLVVANRRGDVSIFRLPAQRAPMTSLHGIVPDAAIGREWVHTPGSVAARRLEPGRFALFVCNNYAHYVSRHIIGIGARGIEVERNEVLLSRGLDIPDGIAISRDRQWIAVSNHYTHCVDLFRNGDRVSEQRVGSLEQVSYPHGICFTLDDGYALVADAGRPLITVYARGAQGWTGTHTPLASLEVMDGGTFARGRYNWQEGGPKGVDTDSNEQVLVTSSEHQVLEFFDLPEFVRLARASRDASIAVDGRMFGPAKRDGDLDEAGGAPAIGRTEPCPCGSGLRFKHCCGRSLPTADAGRVAEFARRKTGALELQESGRLNEAESLYRAALAIAPNDPDCLHMLGMVLYTLGRATEAAPLVRRAGALSGWKLPSIAFNFALVVGARLADRDPARLAAFRAQYGEWMAARAPRASPSPGPLVSIVIRARDDAEHVEAALDSVYAQTYRHLELVVVDDGSRDGSADIIRRKLEACPMPHRFLAREYRGASATLNEAVSLCRGDYVNPLDARHLFAPTRIATLVDEVAARGIDWGFALCDCVDADGQLLAAAADPRAGPAADVEDVVRSCETVGMAMLSGQNPAVAVGNLFFAKALFERVAGFRDGQAAYGWDLCLRLLWQSEPAFVALPLYRYRLRDDESLNAAVLPELRDRGDLMRAYHARALHQTPVNRMAPARATMGLSYLAPSIGAGQGDTLPVPVLERLDDEAGALDETSRRSQAPADLADGLTIVGDFHSDLGWGEGLRELANTCRAESVAAAYRDAATHAGPPRTNRAMTHELTEALPHRNLLFHVAPDGLADVRQRYEDRGLLHGRRAIGYWHWAVDGVPERSRRVLDRFDELWVPTAFARDVTRRFTDTPTFRIPPAIDVALERRWQRAEFSLPDDVFLFLHRCDFRLGPERGNPAAAIRAFRHAFPRGAERAGLVVKSCHSHARPEELCSLVALARGDPRIVFIDRLLTDAALAGLQSVCDAYVSLHRAKALGLGIARAMALGKPAIATAYSGNLDYMTRENSCLVDCTLIPVKPGEYFDYEPGLRWASADIDQAAGCMRRLVADDTWGQRIGERARADIAAGFDRRAAARAIRARLLALQTQRLLPIECAT